MTGLECLNQLPYKIQVQMLKNIAEQENELYGVLINNYESTGQFIRGTFLWHKSSEGQDYWMAAKEKYGNIN